MPSKLSYADRRILEDALCETPPFLTPRGRQTLVRDALGGYANGGQIEKALQWVDWSDAPKLAAADLIRLLEGHEAGLGVPALAVIAQAIESMSGEHMKKLADLRRRMGWTAPDPAAPVALPPSMASASGAAMFISYASEDAGAARCLFEELNSMGAAGAIAWFDKSALKPGDEWDRKNLDAVRGCAYFLPLISQQTEARTDGYFRLEWREAAARSKRIQGRKFIFPIVIDPDYDGDMSRYRLVPEEFKAFQYSHAPGGQMTEVLKTELGEQLRTLHGTGTAGSAG